jgi:hypothetical protein
MVRSRIFAVAWGVLLSACALDLSGLGADLPSGEGGGGGTGASGFEASMADQSTAPQDIDGSETTETDAQGSTPDGALVDGVAPAEASDMSDGPVSDAHSDGGSLCDEDGDGYLAIGACGGTDCCDQDAHVHPGQTSYFTQQGACGGFDYNCDGKETEEYGAASCTWDTFSCSGDGFAAPVPGCGDVGTFTSCSIPWYNVFSCTGDNGQQTQACR